MKTILVALFIALLAIILVFVDYDLHPSVGLIGTGTLTAAILIAIMR